LRKRIIILLAFGLLLYVAFSTVSLYFISAKLDRLKSVEKDLKEVKIILRKVIPSSPSSSPPEPLKVGDYAPRFRLKSLEGKWIALRSFRKSKNVVLLAWVPKCGSCEKVLSTLESFYKKCNPKEVEVLSVTRVGGNTPQGIDNLKSYLKKQKITYPVLISEDDSFGLDYRIVTIPNIWIIDKEGKIKAVMNKASDLLRDDLEEVIFEKLGMKLKSP